MRQTGTGTTPTTGTTTLVSVSFSPPARHQLWCRSRAGLFMDRSGETAGVHEPVSRSPARAGAPNREPGVRRIGAGRPCHRPRSLQRHIRVGCVCSAVPTACAFGATTRKGLRRFPHRLRLQGEGDAKCFVDGSQLVVTQGVYPCP